MSISRNISTERVETPLTREDVLKYLSRVKSSRELDLRGRNLFDIDLQDLDLSGANLSGANLRGANLTDTNLTGVNLADADLRGVDLSGADLGGANLLRAWLSGADLRVSDLSNANLRGANLSDANLQGASLRGASLIRSDLRGANLSRADLWHANLGRAELDRANLRGLKIDFNNKEDLMNALGIGIVSSTSAIESERMVDITLFRVQILEEPLTAYNITLLLSALTELYTTCWLIYQERFADVIYYAQTRAVGIAQEAGLIITRITQNSPANFDFQGKFEVSPQSLAEAMKIGIDAVSQAPYRRIAADLDNQLKKAELEKQQQETQLARVDQEQNRQLEAIRADLERQRSLLEFEKQKIELEREQVELEKARLDLQSQRIKFAMETALQIVDILNPGADQPTKGMLVQTLIPNLLQLGEGKGLELLGQVSSIQVNDQTDITQKL